MTDASETDPNCKPMKAKNRNWKKSIPKVVFKVASMSYSCYRLGSKVYEFLKEFLV